MKLLNEFNNSIVRTEFSQRLYLKLEIFAPISCTFQSVSDQKLLLHPLQLFEDSKLQLHLQHPPFFFCTLPCVFGSSDLPLGGPYLFGNSTSASLRT